MTSTDGNLTVDFPDDDKLYLGSVVALRTLLEGYVHRVMAAYDEYLHGREGADVVLPKIEALAREYGDIIMGRNRHYRIAPWQERHRLGARLRYWYPEEIGRDDDPGEGYFRSLAAQCIAAAQEMAGGSMTDEEAGAELGEILQDNAERMVGLA
ncbi:hypothetical protein [Thiocapsa marina]|uniref:Uncharacterized protein n=1 Tax=Thiocapsa marina 5811 TaxID=768671 RepID=F9UAM5_9GAMM|nr:hypothetical protein [Thiocapsa marina]EGV18777.1 hypothetical protein ThimaDRAFT_2195 [Thiocapsa marina 5811]